MKLTSAILATGLLMGGTAIAHAAPSNIFDLVDDDGNAVFTDTQNEGALYNTGASYVQLTDTDGVQDDIGAFLLFEFAGLADQNKFGIFDKNNPNERLQIFDGPDSPTQGVSVSFDVTNNTASFGDETRDIGQLFGFYLERGDEIFYSDPSLNTDGITMSALYDVEGSTNGQFFGSSIIVAFEDILGPNSDYDFNDMIIGVSDVRAVPEPGTLALFGLGLAAMGISLRRRSNAGTQAA